MNQQNLPFVCLSTRPSMDAYGASTSYRSSIRDEEEDDDDYGDEGRGDCGYYYSRHFLFLDMVWNLAFVVVSVVVLLATLGERPSTPLRLWVSGYALQCLLHVAFVWGEYRTWNPAHGQLPALGFCRVFSFSALCHNSIIKSLDYINTILSSVWWAFGFYWIVLGGKPLLHDSPRLYWLSMVFLAFDVFFMFFCLAMAFVVFFLLFCCFPILASVAYAMTLGNGATENDIRSLPKYLYQQQGPGQSGKDGENDDKQEANLTALPENGISMAALAIHPEDSECCICLYKYVDGAELCMLPCNHHFHHRCIAKWLRINATCPLCKSSIFRGDTLV